MNGRVFEIPTVSACCSVEKKDVATDEVNEGLLHYKNFGNINRNIIFISLMRFLIIEISIFKSTQVSTFARAIEPKTAGVICKTEFSNIRWNLTTKGKRKRIQLILHGQMSKLHSTSLAFIFNHAFFLSPNSFIYTHEILNKV